jgi:transposase
MDAAIKLACANYKSAITNHKRKNIKHFRIRYWRHNKCYNIIDIEKEYITSNSICNKVFGVIKAYYNKLPFNFSSIKSSCKILYDKYLNTFTLLVPEIVKDELIKHPKKLISLDPGIKTFMTGLSENEVLKIGINTKNRLEPLFKQIEKCKNYSNHKKNKIRKRSYRKIKDLVTELHWKTINFLTKTYKIILIGDLSIKSVINNRTSILSDMTKVIGQTLSFYSFKQRLKYKYHVRECSYNEINEKYTSKLCSCCGLYYNQKLGANDIYHCPNCNISIDRDVNGCRGIYLKTLL